MRRTCPGVCRLLLALPAAGFLVVLGAAPALAVGGLSPLIPNGKSVNGHNLYNLYLLISPFALFIFFLIEILLILIIIRFRRSKLPASYRPPQWHGNTWLEITWTAIPTLILVVIGVPSFLELQQDFVKPANAETDMQVVVFGHQFGWTYVYPDGTEVVSEGQNAKNAPLVIPQDKLVRIELHGSEIGPDDPLWNTDLALKRYAQENQGLPRDQWKPAEEIDPNLKRDVIHGFWVPQLTGKTDFVPGYDNYTWFKVHDLGTYDGQCTELCGTGHWTMQIAVQVMDQDHFNAWLAQEKAKSEKAAAPSPSPSQSASPAASPSPSASPGASPSPGPSGSPQPSPSPSP